jgi:hypothetical protein
VTGSGCMVVQSGGGNQGAAVMASGRIA